MASPFAGLARVAKTLVDLNGMTGTLTRTIRANDPVAGTSAKVSTPYTVNIVVESYPARLVDGSNILATDLRVMLAAHAADVTPDPQTDTLTIGGVKHSIVRVEPVYAGDTVATWTVQARRG